MEAFKKQITNTVTVEVFRTTDGKEFLSRTEANIHQGKLDGKLKTCPDCNGTGRVDLGWVKETHNNSWVPTECKEVMVHKSTPCGRCGKKGFLELQWR